MKTEEVVGAAKQPLRMVAWSFGLLRGLAASVIRVASGQRGPVIPGYLPGPVAAPVEENVKHEDVLRYDLIETPEPQGAAPVEPAVQREPEPPGESFVNEPTAVSRQSAHGGGGKDAEIDDWYGEPEAEALPDTIVEILEQGDERFGANG